MKLEEVRVIAEIDKHQLDDENIRQPQLVFEVSQKHADAQRGKSDAKQKVEEVYAELDVQLRKSLVKDGERLTEVQIKNRVALMPKMQQAEHALIDAEHKAAKWFGAFETIKARGYALNNLGDLYSSQYFASESGGKRRSEASERVGEKLNKEAGQMRREKYKKGL